MTRRFPSLRTLLPRLVVATCLLAFLSSTAFFVPEAQARNLHELAPGDETLPNVEPPISGDDDQPTVRGNPVRRSVASVHEVDEMGSGNRGTIGPLEFYKEIMRILKSQARAKRALFNLIR